MDFGNVLNEKRLLSYPRGTFPPCQVIVKIGKHSFLSIDGDKLIMSTTPSILCFSYELLDTETYMHLYNHDMTQQVRFENDKLFLPLKNQNNGTWIIKVDDNLYLSTDKYGLAISKIPSECTIIFPSKNDKQKPILTCPWCFIDGFTEDELAHHGPLWHGNENIKLPCPMCKSTEPQGSKTWGFSTHLCESHGPMSRSPSKKDLPTWSFSLIICQHPETKKFVLIQEGCKNGWWIPAGRVDPGESFTEAAHREMLEEAGLEIDIRGILSFEYHPFPEGGAKQRMILFAHPKDPKAPLKNIPDFESLRATWISFTELKDLIEKRTITLRGSEPYIWFDKVEKGAPIYPIQLLNEK